LPMLPSTKPAAVFLITPLASWAVIVASVAIGTVTSRPPRR
jgi:hypothetical protein